MRGDEKRQKINLPTFSHIQIYSVSKSKYFHSALFNFKYTKQHTSLGIIMSGEFLNAKSFCWFPRGVRLQCVLYMFMKLNDISYDMNIFTRLLIYNIREFLLNKRKRLGDALSVCLILYDGVCYKRLFTRITQTTQAETETNFLLRPHGLNKENKSSIGWR